MATLARRVLALTHATTAARAPAVSRRCSSTLPPFPALRRHPQSLKNTGSDSGPNSGSYWRPLGAKGSGTRKLAYAGIALLLVVAWNLERAPVTGRWRLMFLTPRMEHIFGDITYEKLLNVHGSSMLPPSHPLVIRFTHVASRLMGAAELSESFPAWRVHIINSPLINAFVIPTGHIFVFSGIVEILKNDEEIAALLGHEIAHVYARHTAEQMSLKVPLLTLGSAALLFLGNSAYLMRLLLQRNFSRTMELEADEIGAQLAAKACYDPRAAIRLMSKLQTALSEYRKLNNNSKSNSKSQIRSRMFELLSTHPPTPARITNLENIMPKAYQTYQDTDCAAWGPVLWRFWST